MGAIPVIKKPQFPIGDNVTDCYLKTFKQFVNDETKGVLISFIKGDAEIKAFIASPKKKDYETSLEYKKEAKRVKAMIESVLYAYLTGEDMADILRNCEGSMEQFIDLAREKLTEVGAFETPVILKTLPKKDGSATLPRYPFFVKKPGDDRIKISYTLYEKNNILK